MSTPAGGEKQEIPSSEVVCLTNLVNYRQGVAVSRTLLKRGTGAIVLFALDEGQSIAGHTVTFDALAHVLEGEANMIVGGQCLKAAAGEAVMLPANVPHSVEAVTEFKMLLTMIRS